MGKIFEQKIGIFNGGIENDPRDSRENTCRVVTNFDCLLNPRKMIPYRDSEDGGASSVNPDKQNFALALWTATNPDEWRLFSLGVTSAGGGVARVSMKQLVTTGGGNGDLADNTWLEPTGNSSASGTVNMNLFVYYHRVGKIFGARAGTSIWAFTPDGATAWDDSAQSLTYTSIGQGLVHSKDNILYIPYFNSAGGANAKAFIASYNGTTWNNTALTLPDHLIPTTICEYGNYLAIGCVPASGIGDSIVYLWDRDASLTTLSESINWGEGELKILEEIDGVLIGISMSGNSTTRFNSRIFFRALSGGKAVKIKELFGGTATISLPTAKQRVNNRLYFMMSISINGITREGVWSIGRSTPDFPFSLIHERTPNNDTALSSGILYNFFIIGDFMFIAYNTANTFTVSKTNNASSFTASGIYESKKFTGGDSSITKKLLGCTVMTEALPAAGQVVLKYKKDEETSFTTIFTEATDNSISHSAINIESSGANLPEFKEIEFRIESTGNAEITGLSFQYEVVDKRLY